MLIPAPAIEVTSMTCQRRIEPLGIESRAPLLAWKLSGPGKNRHQTGYQIRVGSGAGRANLWNSGFVKSGESAGVPYRGKSFGSTQRVFWQVRVWDESHRASRWSRPATWVSGIFNQLDWKAKWIGTDASPAPESLLLRRQFVVKPGLTSAFATVTGVGQVEMHLNGAKVSQDLLTPGWTNYQKTVLYDTYDVTKLLKPGLNAAGLLLGNGMYSVHPGRYTKFTSAELPQMALVQIRLFYKNGTTVTVASGRDWSVHSGPLTFSSVFGGEDLDLRLLPFRWSEPGFPENWPAAKELSGPGGTLRANPAPPIRSFQVLEPKSTAILSPQMSVVDLGQNAALMIHLTASGPAGSSIRVTPAELLNTDGTVNRASVGGGQASWKLTLAGPRNTYLPKFFYHGARYLQIERLPDSTGRLPKLERIQGVVVHSDSPETGQFSCSNPLFNRIHTLIEWAQVSNLMSVITDCPHRERLGWLEQYHLNGPSLRYGHDLHNLYEKTVQDMADAQRPNGLVPDIAPEYTVFDGPFVDSPEWGSAMVLVPWQQYQWHRDVSLLARYYPEMKRYVGYLRSTAKDHIVSHGLGDWYDIGDGAPGYSQLTPIPLTATAFYFQDVVILAKVSLLLGKPEEARAYEQEASEIRAAFNRTFFDSAKSYYAAGSQAANAIPFVMDLIEQPHRQSVVDQLVKDVQSHGSFTAGDVGFRYVLRALADAGKSDLIYQMNNQSDKPGYGYQLKMGATSLTEAWDANPSSSQDHFMLGQIMEWFYHDLAGIQPVNGFRKFTIFPATVRGLDWVKASYMSEYGVIGSSWMREKDGLVFDLVIPVNSSAEVILPGNAIDEETDARYGPSFTIGSGHYRFRVPN